VGRLVDVREIDMSFKLFGGTWSSPAVTLIVVVDVSDAQPGPVTVTAPRARRRQKRVTPHLYTPTRRR
jgi:hypothetical protein